MVQLPNTKFSINVEFYKHLVVHTFKLVVIGGPSMTMLLRVYEIDKNELSS